MLDRTPIHERCRGRWRDLLPLCGIDSSYLTGRHGPCPICREGNNRFRFDDKDGRGSWICNQCYPKAGNGLDLLIRARGMAFKEAVVLLEQHLPNARIVQTPARRTPDDARKANADLWSRSVEITAESASGLWLARRCFISGYPAADVLRHCDAIRAPHLSGSTAFHAAMIAKIVAFDGSSARHHRTYLTKDGQKAPLGDHQRAIMPGQFPRGGAVRLSPADDRVGIAEGIETAISASVLFGMPVWAAINTAGLENWIPPAQIEAVTIFADNDANFAGMAAAAKLAKRLATTGGVSVTVEMPPSVGDDWNDVHRKRKGGS